MVAAGLLAGCSRQHHWHQKLTLTVMTPQGEVKGSSVVRVGARYGYSLGAGMMLASRALGEATVVEVAPGKYLFALLSEATQSLAYAVFTDQLPKTEPGDVEARFAAVEDLRATGEVPRRLCPLLVTFADITRPVSVQRVDPSNIAASFGDGYRLTSVTLEITGEPVTDGRVLDILPWLADKAVMENPGWKTLPLESRKAIGGLLTDFNKVLGK